MLHRPARHEITADLLYMLIAMVVSLLVIFIFDIHWSFYPGETVIPPSKWVFGGDLTIYYIGIPLGGLAGFFILKLLFFAMAEERRAHRIFRKLKRKRGG